MRMHRNEVGAYASHSAKLRYLGSEADGDVVYKGLDIITAKVTEQERSAVPHHMMDVIDPLINYCVLDYRKKALPISLLWQILVEDPEESGNLMKGHFNQQLANSAIECEKTSENSGNIQEKITSTIDDDDDDDDESKLEDSDESFILAKKMKYGNSMESNEDLHSRLSQIDPEMARRLHPNNRRKIIR
ncbi:hypothetical protein PV325_006504 [Microctonus aethiopoides]|nr:hypothetical protein PV325_006504 [Microctonus aethiopoides]